MQRFGFGLFFCLAACRFGGADRDHPTSLPCPPGAACDDNDPCTVGDHCDIHGVCSGTPACANRAPIAAGSSVRLDSEGNASGGIDATDGDGDALSFSLRVEPEFGGVTLASDGTFTYSAGPSFDCEDIFEVEVTDSRGGSTQAVVDVIGATPVISAIDPVKAAGYVQVAGDRFCRSPGRVTIGGGAVAIAWWSADLVVAAVPADVSPGALDLQVETAAGAMSAPVHLEASPFIEATAPALPEVGGPLQLIGRAFGASRGLVRIGGSVATITRWDSTAIEVTTRPLAGPQPVYVVSAAGTPSNVVSVSFATADTWVPTHEPARRRVHAAVWTGTELIMWGGEGGESGFGWSSTGDRYDAASGRWSPTSTTGAPSPRYGHTAVWTGDEMIIWGGWGGVAPPFTALNDGARYNPRTDTWYPLPALDAPEPRMRHVAAWTGAEMIMWGGEVWSNFNATYLSSAASYDPILDRWTQLTSGPSGRSDAPGTWTGRHLVVWGGRDPNGIPLSDGARYDPETGAWTALPSDGAPSARMRHTAVWTGRELLVWGGATGWGGPYVTGGAAYDPELDSWRPITSIDAPDPREGHAAVWGGDRMLVWGGYNGPTMLASGGRYAPDTDSWEPTATMGALSPRALPSVAWTGVEVLLWAGDYGGPTRTGALYDPRADTWSPLLPDAIPSSTAAAVWTGDEVLSWGGDLDARYIPAQDEWRHLENAGAPTRRNRPSSVWTGTEFIVWGGRLDDGSATGDGGRFNPVTGQWTPVTSVGAPAARWDHVAVWTGNEMVVWGGTSAYTEPLLADGARYDPASDSWQPTSSSGAPSARQASAAVWTGKEVVIWGGTQGVLSNLNDGAGYDPATDTWRSLPALGAPSGRSGHLAVWTGTEVVVWGGHASGVFRGHFYDTCLDDGGRFDGTSWIPVPTLGLGAGCGRALIWTGTEVGAFGLSSSIDGPTVLGGALFSPASGAWRSASNVGAPASLPTHGFFTGQMVVLLGCDPRTGDVCRYVP